MNEIKWPPESEKPMSIQDFAGQLPTKRIIPALAFLLYRKQKFSYQEWMDLMDIYIELEETERSKIKDAARKTLAEETLYGVWSKY